jgi:hypothetical protein
VKDLQDNNQQKRDHFMLPVRALFHADCFELLDRLPSNRAQLMYLDPPIYENYRVGSKSESFTNYLDFLAKCFLQSKRILAESGNVVLHFQPHYLPYARLILDEIFGQDRFKNEFIVPIQRVSNPEAANYDVIIVYQQSSHSVYNQLYLPHDAGEIQRMFPYEDMDPIDLLVLLHL